MGRALTTSGGSDLALLGDSSHDEGSSGSSEEESSHPIDGKKKEIKLSDMDRSQLSVVMYALIGLGVYLAIGMIYGCHAKGWTAFDSLYFVIVTITTVGYGDYAFPTQNDRVFGSFFVFFGVAIVGVCLSDLFAGVADLLGGKHDVNDEEVWCPSTFHESGANIKQDMEDQFEKKKEGWKRQLRCYAIQLLCVVVVGGVCLWLAEKDGKNHWTIIDAFYFCAVTMTTVGYGDICPCTVTGKTMTIVFICVSFYTVAQAISFAIALPGQIKQKEHKYKVLMQFGDTLQGDELELLLHSNSVRYIRDTSKARAKDSPLDNPNITRAEFMIWMCVKLGKLDKNDVTRAMNVFDSLDKDQSGLLNRGDLVNRKPHVSNF